MRLKTLEAAWKRVVMSAAARLMPAPRRGAAPELYARPHRALYLRYGRIGDMIMSTGILRAIASSHEGLTLDVLASPVNATILDGNPNIGSVVIFDRRRWRSFPALCWRLRRSRYDMVVDPMVLSPSMTTVLLMAVTGAPYRIGVGGRTNDFIYTLPHPAPDPAAHHLQQEAGALSAFGLDPLTTDLRGELFLTECEREWAERRWSVETTAAADSVRLLVNVSTALAKGFWPDSRYVATLQHVTSRWPGVCPLVVGALHEAARVTAIAREAGVGADPTATLRQALALVGSATVVFTPDTAIAHAAAALGKPAVVMLPRGAGIFAPYGNSGRDVYSDTTTLATLRAGIVMEALDAELVRVSV